MKEENVENKKELLEEQNEFRLDYKRHIITLQIITIFLTLIVITTFIWSTARYGMIIGCLLIILYNWRLNKLLKKKIFNVKRQIEEEGKEE